MATTTPTAQPVQKLKVTSSISFMQRLQRTVVYIILFAGAAVLMVPFLWMVSTSLKRPGAVFVFPPEWIPNPFVWTNYPMAWNHVPFTTFTINTVIITAWTVVGATLTSAIVGYSFARLRWVGRDPLFLIVIATMMLPQHVTMIPVFAIWRSMGFVNTFIPLIVPAFFGGGPFNIFLMRQFFMTLPLDLDDAAKIDGCGVFGVFWRIVGPLSKPVIGTVAIFQFLYRWNDFMGPLIYLNDQKRYTLALGLQLFRGQYETKWELLMAASVIVMMPVLVIYFFAQRYFVQGIVFTGVKG